MSKEALSVDTSNYQTFYTLPREARANRLEKPMKLKYRIHGKEVEIEGEKGDWHVVMITPTGKQSAQHIYTQDEFEKYFGEYSEQMELKFKTKPAKDKSNGEDEED